jgi:hypothetical protein
MLGFATVCGARGEQIDGIARARHASRRQVTISGAPLN